MADSRAADVTTTSLANTNPTSDVTSTSLASTNTTSDFITTSFASINTTSEKDFFTSGGFFILDQVTQTMQWYLPPVVILFGTFGNVMTIVIMRRMTSSDSVINVYFVSLAVVDLMGLYTVAFRRWLTWTWGVKLQDLHVVTCKVLIWLAGAVPTTTSWVLVCLTTHRAVSVAWPHKVGLLFTKKRVVVAICIAALAAGLVYCQSLYTVSLIPSHGANGSQPLTCFLQPQFFHVYQVFPFVDLVAFSLLPFLCLVVGNTVLIRKLALSVKVSTAMTSTPTSITQTAARSKTASSVTVTVVVVSLTFVILTLPGALALGIFFLGQTSELSGLEQAEADFVNSFSIILGDMNHAVNFYLYCLTGRRFREEFLKVVCGSRSWFCLRASHKVKVRAPESVNSQLTCQSEVHSAN